MHNSTLKDIFSVMSSNFMLLLSSIATGLIIPMVLGTTNYGYYRTFTLYMNYTGLLTFGFVDGIVLIHGGEKYAHLNKLSFRSSSQFFLLFQVLISGLIIFISFFVYPLLNQIIIIFVGINSFLMNITVYYQCISQAVMRFSQLSLRKTCQALIMTFLTIFLWIFYELHLIYNSSCIIYILVILFSDLVLFIWYLISYSDLTFGKKYSIKRNFKQILLYFHTGIYLTISSQMSTIILIIDNQFVSFFFSKSEYGKYSFANSMSSSALNLLSAVSIVLLPRMKQLSKTKILKNYPKMLSYMLIIIFGILLGYFPLCEILSFLLPKYILSLQYFRFFLPGIGVAGCVTMIICNYYNVLGKSKFYFYISVFILILAIIIDAIVYNFSHSSILLSYSSLIELILWYMLSEYFLVKWFKVKRLKNLLYMMLLLLIFIILSGFNDLLVGFILYLVFYSSISLLVLRKEVMEIVERLYGLILNYL